ncbi:MAG: stage III sporulation protein AF [Clostridia bacterium]|nr:stage III sporulation protein AF [Clostridia bacterium]
MENYISTIITISILGSVVLSLVSEKSSLKKYVNMVLSLICVIALLSPITSLLLNIDYFKSNIMDFLDSTMQNEAIDNSNKIIIESGVESIENGIQATIVNRFSLDERDVLVRAIIDEKNIESVTIKGIEVTLSNKAIWSNADSIRDYIYNLTGIEVNVRKK